MLGRCCMCYAGGPGCPSNGDRDGITSRGKSCSPCSTMSVPCCQKRTTRHLIVVQVNACCHGQRQLLRVLFVRCRHTALIALLELAVRAPSITSSPNSLVHRCITTWNERSLSDTYLEMYFYESAIAQRFLNRGSISLCINLNCWFRIRRF